VYDSDSKQHRQHHQAKGMLCHEDGHLLECETMWHGEHYQCLLHWRWRRQQVLPNCWQHTTRLDVITSQKTANFTVIIVKSISTNRTGCVRSGYEPWCFCEWTLFAVEPDADAGTPLSMWLGYSTLSSRLHTASHALGTLQSGEGQWNSPSPQECHAPKTQH
jgi:hypothetical protein